MANLFFLVLLFLGSGPESELMWHLGIEKWSKYNHVYCEAWNGSFPVSVLMVSTLYVFWSQQRVAFLYLNFFDYYWLLKSIVMHCGYELKVFNKKIIISSLCASTKWLLMSRMTITDEHCLMHFTSLQDELNADGSYVYRSWGYWLRDHLSRPQTCFDTLLQLTLALWALHWALHWDHLWTHWSMAVNTLMGLADNLLLAMPAPSVQNREQQRWNVWKLTVT